MNNALGVTRMITQHASLATSRSPRIAGSCSALVALLLAFAGAAQAENVLEEITYQPGPGGQVDVRMKLSEPPVEPKLFTTDSPARIAVDFDNTRSALTERRINVGTGATSAISAVEAGGRTRVVVELFRSSSYTSRVEGDTLIVSIGNGSRSAAAGSAVAGNDPTKASLAGRPAVSGIDFRRGKGGEGRVIINFTGEGASTDLRREGNRLVVDVANATLPADQAERLDVTDFATPVQSVEVRSRPNGARIEVAVDGAFEQLAYQTGSEYVVEISPVRVESPAELAMKEPEYVGERVTFNFQDIPVRSVLQLIADVSDLNVVVADSVTGNVTLRLVNVPWDQALDIILQAKGLDQRRRGNVVWVAPATEIAAREQALEDARIALEDRSPLVSEYIPINFGKAKDIAELLTSDALSGQTGGGGGEGGASSQKGFLSPRGSVTFDERTNTLLVNDTPEKIAEIKALIVVLDRAVDQVLIESRIVIADETFGRELGARFGLSGAYEDNQGNVITTGGTLGATDQMSNEALRNRLSGVTSGLPVGRFDQQTGAGVLVPSLLNRLGVNLPVQSAAGSFALAVLGQDYLLDLELSALQTEGKGEVISSPRVITANQREAVIRQGDEVGYVTISPQSGGGSVPIPNVQFKEVLLELKVIPTITQDERVYLSMNVKKDEIARFVSTSIGDVPQITKREINTAVLVENGQTVVLGGVYEFSTRDDLTKVPFLGDLPAVGALFRNKARSSEKAELLIFVTPKILGQGSRY
jgi:type IV pilus assembly protein PilQ